MRVAKQNIKKALEERGYLMTPWNLMTIKDALGWENREDYDTIQDAVDAIVEEYESQLK